MMITKTGKIIYRADDFIIPVNLMGCEGNPVDLVNPIIYSYWLGWVFITLNLTSKIFNLQSLIDIHPTSLKLRRD